MTEASAREAMRAYCKQYMTVRCPSGPAPRARALTPRVRACIFETQYSKDPAIGMTLTTITPGFVYRVQLDTFLESRTVQWVVDSFPGPSPAAGARPVAAR